MTTPELSSSKKGQGWFFASLFAISLLFMIYFPRISFPVASAYVASLVLRPLRDTFLNLPGQYRVIATVLILATIALLVWPLVIVFSALGDELSILTNNLPRYEFSLQQKFSQLKRILYQNLNVRIDIDPVAMILKKLKKDGVSWIVDVPKMMGNVLEWMILTPVFTWFFLHDSLKLKQGFLQLVPNHWFERSYMLFHQFNGRFGGYIVAKTIEATILGVLLMIGLWVAQFPYAFLLAILGGLTNVVPYVGPILGWGAALVVGLLQQPINPEALMAMSAVYAVANFIDMALVFPLLVSRIVNLHPLIVVVSVIVGSEVGGLVGMIVSVPVATFIKLVLVDIHKSLYVESPK